MAAQILDGALHDDSAPVYIVRHCLRQLVGDLGRRDRAVKPACRPRFGLKQQSGLINRLGKRSQFVRKALPPFIRSAPVEVRLL